jgi:hypothetical protein
MTAMRTFEIITDKLGVAGIAVMEICMRYTDSGDMFPVLPNPAYIITALSKLE